MRKKGTQGLIQGLIHKAVRDVIVPTSMGLGLAVAGCDNSTENRSDSSADVTVPELDTSPAHPDAGPIYAIMPPQRDAAADTVPARPDSGPIYAILPPTLTET